MTRSELKQQAKDSLRGRWGTAIGMILVYWIILGVFSFIGNFIPVIGSMVIAVISIPLTFGFVGQMMKFTRNEEVKLTDFLTRGFNNFGKAWSILGNTILKLLPLVIACAVLMGIMVGVTFSAFAKVVASASATEADVAEAVTGAFGGLTIVSIALFVVYIILIIQSYYYVLTEYIGNDNPEMTGKEIVEASKNLMQGHRWEFFVLNLSFLGWAILTVFTFGIGVLWLEPYMQVTFVKYYENLAQKNSGDSVQVIEEA